MVSPQEIVNICLYSTCICAICFMIHTDCFWVHLLYPIILPKKSTIFNQATAFNQNLSTWDTSSVVDMVSPQGLYGRISAHIVDTCVRQSLDVAPNCILHVFAFTSSQTCFHRHHRSIKIFLTGTFPK